MGEPHEVDLPTDEPASVKRKQKWLSKESLSLGFSATALLLSGLTTYFNFFRDDTTVLATVVGVRDGRPSVAVMNTGNRQVTVSDGYMYLTELGGSEDDSTIVGQPAAGAQFPVLIEPGRMALIEFAFNPFAFDPKRLTCEPRGCDYNDRWIDLVETYRTYNPTSGTHTHDAAMGFKLEVIGVTGVRLSANVDALTLELMDTEIYGFATRNDVVQLLEVE
jgi:hypothetical protein